MAGSSAIRSATASVSLGIAEAAAHVLKANEPQTRFPGEDGGRSLVEMAHRDLDAALQLLAERAHYITGASGAAIALRRGEHNDMLCRASAGSNAPDLGALLSMDYGLSGESVRTRQVLRCDDAERDPRVNREVCRQLGIASVVVMPIVSDDQVLGVFELLSGEPRTFGERDLSALRRLSEMVEIAVKYAIAAQTVPGSDDLSAGEPEKAELAAAGSGAELVPADSAPAKLTAAESQPPIPAIASQAAHVDIPSNESAPEVVPAAAAPAPPEQKLSPFKLQPQESRHPESDRTEPAEKESEKPGSEKAATPSPKKPLFWSAAMHPQISPALAETAAESAVVPPGLRNLQKCKACGFPVSQGRTLCVECEEKQWRGQRLPQPATTASQPAACEPQSQIRSIQDPAISRVNSISSAQTNNFSAAESAGLKIARPTISARQAAATAASHNPVPGPTALKAPTTQPSSVSSSVTTPAPAKNVAEDQLADLSRLGDSAPFLSSAVQSQSWLAANKYILGALVAVAIVIGVIALLH